MPTYRYRHRESGKTLVQVWTVAHMLEQEGDSDGITVDDEFYYRDYSAEHNNIEQRGCAAWPIKSDSAGVNPTQISEFSEKASKMGVPTQFDSKTGQAIFTSRGHRSRYMKLRGLHDRQGGYGDG